MGRWTEKFERYPEGDIEVSGIPVALKAWQPTDGTGTSISDYSKISAVYTVSDPCGMGDILYDMYGNVSTKTLLTQYITAYTDAVPVNDPSLTN